MGGGTGALLRWALHVAGASGSEAPQPPQGPAEDLVRVAAGLQATSIALVLHDRGMWDFETDPEFQAEARLGRPASSARRSSRSTYVLGDPYDKTRRAGHGRSSARCSSRCKDQGLWAAHLGPELGGQGYGQVKLALLNEILGRSRLGAVGVRLPGARLRQRRDPRPLRHRRAEGASTSSRCSTATISSCYSMTEPHAGADPTLFTTRAERDGDEWVINGEKWFSSQRPLRQLLHRHGGDQPRRERLPGHVDVHRPGRHARASRSSATSASAASRDGPRHATATSATRTCGCPADHLLGGEGGAFVIAQTRLGGGRIHHAMRTIAQVRKAFDMMCERAVSRADAHRPAGVAADDAGEDRRQLDRDRAVPPARAAHRLADRQAQGLQARSARTSPP